MLYKITFGTCQLGFSRCDSAREAAHPTSAQSHTQNHYTLKNIPVCRGIWEIITTSSTCFSTKAPRKNPGAGGALWCMLHEPEQAMGLWNDSSVTASPMLHLCPTSPIQCTRNKCHQPACLTRQGKRMHLMHDKISTFCLKQYFIFKVPTANKDGDFLTRLQCS